MLKVGDKAPRFMLVDDSGKKISLKDFKGKKVVLYFYPKDLTPGCTVEACDFRDASALFKKKKAVVLGVSRDSVALHKKFKEKHELNFPLLADEDGKVCEAFGVWQEKSMYGKKYMGIARTTFVIDEQGKVEQVFEKVKVKGHIDEVLEAL
ncbi:MAG: thioredoxin-dependent thiol peroxidase [Proteobacteria bacterium]|nr:thioredoxin-dependent thiol peroxidase [Pseudomonadota bacterium]NDC23161.1 thioredoxin-dependent thiol peroxidase [Pseudomonadota bacterium]NDD03371.1 thioredoxin-dependent thiol peroxidase [Pseudomonadota bacterium]NDG26957.1 thioredoxin-dependent thiol peroxidase [Pseudomonadota bacterium]